MLTKPDRQKCLNYASIGAVIMGLTGGPIFSTFAQAEEIRTLTPIKHVIVIVGENRTFDHLFGTYQPRWGQTVSNLLS
ncbi:alkaline phosphatase family protein, partial [Nostoc sp.]